MEDGAALQFSGKPPRDYRGGGPGDSGTARPGPPVLFWSAASSRVPGGRPTSAADATASFAVMPVGLGTGGRRLGPAGVAQASRRCGRRRVKTSVADAPVVREPDEQTATSRGWPLLTIGRPAFRRGIDPSPSHAMQGRRSRRGQRATAQFLDNHFYDSSTADCTSSMPLYRGCATRTTSKSVATAGAFLRQYAAAAGAR